MRTVPKTDYLKSDVDVRMAQDALDAQSACNLTALAQALARHTKTLMNSAMTGTRGGTDWVNQHPVVILIVWQMSHLSMGITPLDDGRWVWAYEFCSDIVNGEKDKK